jgi:hypothetical protein
VKTTIFTSSTLPKLQPGDEFHKGVKYARQQMRDFINEHDGILTLQELIKEIDHWESKDTEYSLRDFATGELIIVLKGWTLRVSEQVDV